jgi:hypothetical protein
MLIADASTLQVAAARKLIPQRGSRFGNVYFKIGLQPRSEALEPTKAPVSGGRFCAVCASRADLSPTMSGQYRVKRALLVAIKAYLSAAILEIVSNAGNDILQPWLERPAQSVYELLKIRRKNMAKERDASNRGFASMDESKQKEIARKGGQSVPDEKRSFSQDHELASEAGRKGGQSVPAEKRSFSQDHELASEAGRKGGQASGGNFAHDKERAADAGRRGGQSSHDK